MSSIDWSNAPDSATHLVKCTDPKFEREYWCVESGDRYNNVASGAWLAKDSVGKNGWLVFARPTPWQGEVLPPVGTVCEYQCGYVEQPFRHAECTVIAHFVCESGKTLAAFTYVAHDGIVQLGRGTPELFRPIRTAEQIAADERLHEIRNALTTINSKVLFPNDLVRGNILAAAVEAMIDSGYRKVTP